MLELQKAIMIEVTQILKNKLCMFSFFLFYWHFGSFKLCTPILLTFWPPIFHILPSSLPPAHKRKQVKASKGKKANKKKTQNRKITLLLLLFPCLSNTSLFILVVLEASVCHIVYTSLSHQFFWQMFTAMSYCSGSRLLVSGTPSILNPHQNYSGMFCGWALEIFLVSRGYEYRGADFRGGWPQGPELTSLATS